MAIFYKRGAYYWIGSDNSKKNDAKWFGDVDRAMNKFSFIDFNNEIRIPDDVDRFLYDYKHSMFIECNKKLARLNRDSLGSEYKIDYKRENDFLHGLKYIKSILEGFNKNYWLAAGTLLGMNIFLIIYEQRLSNYLQNITACKKITVVELDKR